METKGRTIGSILREMAVNRNTELRRKVENVGRPKDDVKDPDTSKLAKQGEIKTKIIDEEQIDEKYAKGYKSPWDKIEKAKPGIGARIEKAAADVKKSAADYQAVVDKDKKKPVNEASDNVPKDDIQVNANQPDAPKVKDKKKDADGDDKDPKKIKGGKTEVDLEPKTNDTPEDTSKEDAASKKATKQENNKIGAKGVKEQTMLKNKFGLSDSLIQSVNEVLKGNQHKIDANHNGKIDAQDFKILKGKKKVSEGSCSKCGSSSCKCSHNEEVEELDEISKKTAMSAYQSASDAAGEHPKQDAIRGHIEKKWGKEMGKHADAHAHVSNYGRNEPGKRAGDFFKHQDKLTGFDKTKPGRISKSGTMNKRDQKYNASAIKKSLGTHTKPKLPEEVQLSEAELARIEEILKGQE